MTDDATPTRPLLRVVRGEPTAEELAALLAVVGGVGAGPGGAAARPARPARSAWNEPARLVRPTVHPGPDGWRRSARVTG